MKPDCSQSSSVATSATLEALELLGPNLCEPWRLRGLLLALGYSPSPDAEEVLKSLPHKDARFLDEHDWVAALEKRGTAVAARVLLDFITEGAFPNRPGGIDARTLSHSSRPESAPRHPDIGSGRAWPIM